MKKRHLDFERTQVTRPNALNRRSLSRRVFLLQSGAVLAATTALSGLPQALARELARDTFFSAFSDHQKSTLSAVQEHLFPSDAESPGAMDINALAYLQAAITQPGFKEDSRNFIVNGIQSLEEASMERYDRVFADLGFAQKESLLRYLADHTRWGRNWLSLLLYYIFESLLADPVYGCNPDGIGWKWLEHQPGFPRPPANKIYSRL
ncbi:MAG: gluconate 2-dehydrogenase subunit 3 family protein [Proteobacteria bacterium]|nr:gluconate 2-dehydrogenase subunit 3 family protein [Pseudomonadota bacterium]